MLKEVITSKSRFFFFSLSFREDYHSVLDDLHVRPSHCSIHPSRSPQADSRGRWVSTQADPRVCLTPSWELRLDPRGASASSALRQGFGGTRGSFSATCLRYFPFFWNNPVTRICYFSPFSRPCIGCCVLSPPWPPVWLEDAAVEVTEVMLQILFRDNSLWFPATVWFFMWWVFTHHLWIFSPIYIFTYISSWSDKRHKVRSGLTWRALHDCETHLMHMLVHQFWFVLLYSV